MIRRSIQMKVGGSVHYKAWETCRDGYSYPPDYFPPGFGRVCECRGFIEEAIRGEKYGPL